MRRCVNNSPPGSSVTTDKLIPIAVYRPRKGPLLFTWVNVLLPKFTPRPLVRPPLIPDTSFLESLIKRQARRAGTDGRASEELVHEVHYLVQCRPAGLDDHNGATGRPYA